MSGRGLRWVGGRELLGSKAEGPAGRRGARVLRPEVDPDEAGVRIFYYLEDREAKLDSATGKLLEQVRNSAPEMEREKASQRTADAMLRKAEAGARDGRHRIRLHVSDTGSYCPDSTTSVAIGVALVSIDVVGVRPRIGAAFGLPSVGKGR